MKSTILCLSAYAPSAAFVVTPQWHWLLGRPPEVLAYGFVPHLSGIEQALRPWQKPRRSRYNRCKIRLALLTPYQVLLYPLRVSAVLSHVQIVRYLQQHLSHRLGIHQQQEPWRVQYERGDTIANDKGTTERRLVVMVMRQRLLDSLTFTLAPLGGVERVTSEYHILQQWSLQAFLRRSDAVGSVSHVQDTKAGVQRSTEKHYKYLQEHRALLWHTYQHSIEAYQDVWAPPEKLEARVEASFFCKYYSPDVFSPFSMDCDAAPSKPWWICYALFASGQ